MANEEMVALVNESNEVIGASPRARMRAERLIHRATYIFVFDRGGELFVQRRTATKDMYPSYYDLAAGGVVQAGESYQSSARREAAEELGIVDTPLAVHFDFYYEDALNRIWGRAFSCVHEGPFRLQPEEVESGEFWPAAEVLSGRIAPITPDTRHAFELLRQRSPTVR